MSIKFKVGIMAQCGGIVPAIYGGAVESLLTMLIDENEKTGLCEFTLFCTYDFSAKKIAHKYKHTKFIFIKQDFCRSIYYRFKRLAMRKFFPASNGLMNDFSRKVFNLIKKYYSPVDEFYDFFIIQEGRYVNGLNDFCKLFGEKIFYHSHLHEIPVHGSVWPNVISVSDFCRKEWLSVPSETKNVYVLKNGIDLEKFSKCILPEERSEIRHGYNIRDNDIVIIYVGRVIPEKGVKELLIAVNLLDDERIKLLIVGSSDFARGKMTPYLSEVHSIVKNMKDRVLCVGYISNDELYKYYQIADIQVVPSMWEEAAGLVSIEGMASGLPLVVTKSGGLIEYVDEKCALIVDKENDVEKNISVAIRTLADDAILRKNMGAYAKKRATMFSKRNFYMNFIDIIKENMNS